MSIEVPILILLIAIPTYFLIKRLLKRRVLNTKKRTIIALISTAVMAPLLYVGFILIFISYLFYEPQYDFDKEKWISNKYDRHEMRDDLIESGVLKGITKTEALNLLGKPENNDSLNLWKYNLGTSTVGFGWQFNTLELYFENNKVAQFRKIEIVD